MIKDYKILGNYCLDLEKDVKRFLDAGYVLHGTPFVAGDNNYIYQAVVKYETVMISDDYLPHIRLTET